MYTVEIDLHCHSIVTKHAMCTILEILDLAKRKGLKGVAISDHHPSLAHNGDDYRIDAPDDAHFSVFCHRFEALDNSVRLFKSIELNILDRDPWLYEASANYDDKFDFRIAGVHVLPHLFKKCDDIVKNTDAVLAAINLGDKPKFQILAHPHMKDVELDLTEIIKACKNRGIALELNNSNLLYNKTRMERAREFLEKSAFYGASISVASDAHAPHEVGLFDSSLDLLSEMNFPEELIVNRTMASFNQFIDDFKNSPM